MRAEVPFIPQEGAFDCGPTMLRIVAEWGGKDISYQDIKDTLGWEPGNAVSTAQVCLAADTLGFNATLYSVNMDFEQDMYEGEEYYQEHGDVQGAEKAFSKLERREDLSSERVLTTEDLRERLGTELVIALLNWEETRDGEGYTGHFVVVTGVTESLVYVHQVGDDAEADMALNRSVFKAARSDPRTDQDVLCISR